MNGGRAGAGDGPDPAGAPDPPAGWFDDAAVEAAAAARRAGHDAALRARESATWVGTLTDLAEARAEVQVRTSAGTAHAGTLVAVADDHVLLRRQPAVTIVARTAVVAVQPHDAVRPPTPATGDRGAPQDRTLAEVLAAWVDDRATGQVVLRGGDQVTGQLVTVGVDVVTLVAGDGPVHVPVDAIVAVTVR